MRLCSLKNTCLHAWKSATNKQFNGQGFTAPPTSPDLKESGGRLKGGEVTLNGKAAVSSSGCKPPGCRALQSKALSLCSAETCDHGGEAASGTRGMAPASSLCPGHPRHPPSPGVPWLPVAQRDMHFSLSAEEPSNRCLRLSHYQPPTGADPAGCSPLAWPEDQCPVAALGHMQERSSTPPRAPT